MFSGSECQRKR